MRISDWSSDVCSSDLNDRAIANGGVPLARDSSRRVRSAQGHALINGDIVPDRRRFPYDGKAMINKKVTTDLRPRVNVDGSQKTGEMIDQAGQKIKARAEQPVSNAMQSKRKHAGVQQNFPAGSRRRVARLHRIEIRSEEHTSEIQSLM